MRPRERVVTLMWGNAWERYGQAFARSFAAHWRRSVELVIVTDRELPAARSHQIGLPYVPGYVQFMSRWKDDRRANGFDRETGKKDSRGKSWRHDAVKWAPQALAPIAALDGLKNGDTLAWFDADVETIRDVPAGWLSTLLGDADVACLQRPRQATEIGFWAIRYGPKTDAFIRRLNGFYTGGDVFDLDEWHSGYVFDRALESVPDLNIRNVNEAERRGHVWPHTALAEFTVHKKGKRKGA